MATWDERIRALEARVAALEGAKRKKRGKTPAPDDLTTEEKRALLDWVRSPVSRRGIDRADLVPQLRKLVDACLDFHRSKGNLHVDWLATCRTWIRNVADGRFTANAVHQPTNGARPLETFQPPREPGIDYEAERQQILQMAAERRERDGGLH